MPDAIVKTVNGLTKVFIGEIIERARDVQAQWEAAEAAARPSPLPASFSSDDDDDGGEDSPAPARPSFLLPQHLREALRRYRRDREGGAVGMRMANAPAMRGGVGGIGVGAGGVGGYYSYPAATGGRRRIFG